MSRCRGHGPSLIRTQTLDPRVRGHTLHACERGCRDGARSGRPQQDRRYDLKCRASCDTSRRRASPTAWVQVARPPPRTSCPWVRTSRSNRRPGTNSSRCGDRWEVVTQVDPWIPVLADYQQFNDGRSAHALSPPATPERTSTGLPSRGPKILNTALDPWLSRHTVICPHSTAGSPRSPFPIPDASVGAAPHDDTE